MGARGLSLPDPLRAPGDAGFYQPASATASLSFDLAEISPDIAKPTEATWEKNWQALHEWSHFYQYATTSYGFFYQGLTAFQLLMVNGLLTLYDPSSRRCRLPLLRPMEVDSTSLAEMASGQADPQWLFHLWLIGRLDEYRKVVSESGSRPSFSDALSPEWRIVGTLLREQAGLPPIVPCWPEVTERLGAWRFTLSDLLESHAAALATLWVAQAVERYELPASITRSAVDYLNSLEGPYAEFLQYAHDLPADPRWRIHLFCALCDLALNPPIVIGQERPDPVLVMPETTWSPVTRLWQLILLARDKGLPHVDLGRPEWKQELASGVKEALEQQGEYFLPLPVDQAGPCERVIGWLERLLQIEDVPEPLGLLLIDLLGTFSVAEVLREANPLLLGGGAIEELRILFQTLAGPTVLCRSGARQVVYSRIAIAVAGRKGVPQSSLVPFSDAVARRGIPAAECLRKLMLYPRRKLEKGLHEPLFGNAGPTLAECLGWYNLGLEDFD